MSLLKLLTREAKTPPGEVADPAWRKSPKGYFYRLLSLNLGLDKLKGVGGVYVLWHRGLRPRWVYVGATDDLGRSLSEARDHPGVLAYEPRGGLYVTWSPIVAEYRPGVLLYLREVMAPLIAEPLPWDETPRRAEPVPVRLPGMG